MVGAGVDLELAIHRIAHLGLRQHAAHRFLDELHRPALADINGALFAPLKGSSRGLIAESKIVMYSKRHSLIGPPTSPLAGST